MQPEAPEAGAGGRRRTAPLGAVVSLVSVAGCAWWASRQESPQLPDSPGHVALLVGAIVVYAGITFARGWRWGTIMTRANVPHSRADPFELTVIGYMGNTVLPARGGEVLRILLLRQRSGARAQAALGSIVPERLLDAATLVALFSALTVLGVAGSPAGSEPAIIGTAVLLAIPAAVVVYLRLRRAGRFERFADRVRPVAVASRMLATRTGFLLALLTVAIWFAESVVLWLVAQSIDVSLTPIESVFIVVVASFFALIPAGPGYLGTFDAALLFGLNAVDVRGGSAIGFVLLYRFVIFVPITVAGMILVVVRYGGLGMLRPGSRVTGEPAPAVD